MSYFTPVCFLFLFQMVIPGDVAEMTEFQDKNMNNSRFILELCFPNVQLSLPSKAFYEKLHNRCINSLTFFVVCSTASPRVYMYFFIAENQQIRRVCMAMANLFGSRPHFWYFRINNDLLLWEPTAPSPVETVDSMPYGIGLSVASQLINTYSKDSFSQFRSTCPEGEAPKNILYNNV